ncbi:hypothetical protein HEK616_84260 (plasmid) [Streptomyces nigrescens]|uniref:Uncharacterized protein n=1 Tax=Streptomyces nigrescens TaxID=1920 RepID=A0ABN6R981_STRNI|nr:hypothetical protein [Streptomyces nigrescens]BDM74939.1 hypothetical protein HEK616_84260 [Streptomyces nigrescens]
MPMRAVRITSPVEDFTGDGPGGLAFTDGTATTSDRAIIGYCQGAGYLVEPLGEGPPTVLQDAPNGPSDSKSAGRSAARSKRG